MAHKNANKFWPDLDSTKNYYYKEFQKSLLFPFFIELAPTKEVYVVKNLYKLVIWFFSWCHLFKQYKNLI
jgi:hypothetical protein